MSSLITLDQLQTSLEEITPSITALGEIFSSDYTGFTRLADSTVGTYSFAYGYPGSLEASGAYSHAEGYNTTASANYSHAEGNTTTASGASSHAEGVSTTASANYSHAEGVATTASGNGSHAEGQSTHAYGNHSHAEGYNTCTGDASSSSTYGCYAHAEGYGTLAYANALTSVIINDNGDMIYIDCSHAEGYGTKASSSCAHAEGNMTVASSTNSHAEGYNTIASASASHAEGYITTASGSYGSHAEGRYTKASGTGSHSQNYYTIAASNYSSAAGYYTETYTVNEFVIGQRNTVSTTAGGTASTTGNAFVIGNGTSSSALSNAFRVTKTGYAYGLAAYTSSGADYAEFIKEWADGNEDNEDRVGYFVTIRDGLLYKANEGDYIAGITSGNPSIIGNGDEDYYWRFERDEFNRFIMEDVEEEVEQTDEDGHIVINEETGEAVMVKTGNIIKNGRFKWNEDYDASQEYVERKDRPEWDYVGMIGVLPVRDDGTCVAGSYCKCGVDGVATAADTWTMGTYFVIERISDSVVSVIMK